VQQIVSSQPSSNELESEADEIREREVRKRRRGWGGEVR
jgi:hypothetical protein